MNDIEKEVNYFLKRRFPQELDCNWTNGNCYYFALILIHAFPNFNIYYDYAPGHFVAGNREENIYFDFKGIYVPISENIIPTLEEIKQKDSQWYGRLIRDCVQ